LTIPVSARKRGLVIDVNSNLNTSKKRDEFWSGFASGNSERKFAASEAKSALMSKDARAASNSFYDWIYDAEKVHPVAVASPQDAQLDNKGATLTPVGDRGDKSSDISRVKDTKASSRWRLKHSVSNLLRPVNDGEKTPSVCKCGCAAFDTEEVTLSRRDGKAALKGVYFCDSPWLCPSCAPRRAAQRAEKVDGVFKATKAKEGQIVFVTLTVQHRKNDKLKDLKEMVSLAGRKAREGNPWKLAQERYDIAGTLVSPEVTYSLKHGWHYHLHLAVVVLNKSEELAIQAGEWLVGRYVNYIEKMGGNANRKAQDVRICWRDEDLSNYISKGSAAWEISSAGATKEAAFGSLNPWDLVARASKGDAKCAALFKEYADCMPGTRSCVITPKLAEKLGILPHADEDAAGVEDEVLEEFVGVIEKTRWHRILRNGYAADVLKVTSARWKFEDIDYLISCLLGEPDRNKYMENSQSYTSVVDRTYVVSDEEFAMKVAARTASGSGRKLGASIQIQIQVERDYAEARSKHFIMPNLKNVMRILSA